MLILWIFTIFIFVGFSIVVMFLRNLYSELQGIFWQKTALVCVSSVAVLFLLSFYSFILYILLVGIMVMGAREASKYMFSHTQGFILLGIYFALWLSLPFGVYQLLF